MMQELYDRVPAIGTVQRGPYAGQEFWILTEASQCFASWQDVLLKDSEGDFARRDVRNSDLELS